ncbi:MAG: WcaI family glycosyltransferase [Bacteroidota bacterium]
MSRKRILVIGINSAPEPTGIGRYTGEMLEWLVANGYEVTMVTAFAYYPQWKIQPPYSGHAYKKEVSHEGKLTVYRCPLYVPANPTGLKRLIHEATFHVSAFFVILRLLFKQTHQITLAIAPPFHLGTLALFYSWFKKTRTIYHIQDLQVDVAKELDILKQKWMFETLFGLEKFILSKVDVISTISDGIRKKIRTKIDKPVMIFLNWVDTAHFYPVSNRNDLKVNWGFSTTDKVVMYSGSIGEKQGLSGLVNVAKDLPDIKFVICGTGPFKDKLQVQANEMGLSNVYFFPLQTYSVFNDFLNMADLHLVLQKGGASDLMMPSKLSTILAIGGLVLVTAKPQTALYDVITDHKMGLVVEPENDLMLGEAILDCLANASCQERVNARRFAEANLSRDNVLGGMFGSV